MEYCNLKFRYKTLLSLLFVIAAFLLFALPIDKKVTRTVKNDQANVTIVTIHNGCKKFCEWIGIFLLALAVWVWRKELGVTSVGLISGPSVAQQQSPKDLNRDGKMKFLIGKFREKRIRPEEIDITKKKNFKNKILKIIKMNKSADENYVASNLSITHAYAKGLLMSLVQEGKLRCDSIGDRTLYTLPNMLENIAIDKIIKKIKSEGKSLIGRGRFIKLFSKYSIDAYLEWKMNGKKYDSIVEIKHMKISPDMDRRIYKWVLALNQIRDELWKHRIAFEHRMSRWQSYNITKPITRDEIKSFNKSVIGYLIIVAEKKTDFMPIQRIARKYSELKDVFNIEIITYSKDELLST